MAILEFEESTAYPMSGLSSRKWLLVLGAMLFIAVSGFAANLILSHNYHTVVAGELYRAAQIPADELGVYKNRDGIRSVLNLRGPSKKPWYAAEVAEAKKVGLTHIDFRMESDKQLDDAQITQLLKIMKDAPKPLLIHCESGANRTGLAAALYLVSVKNETAEDAAQQLSLKFGHVGIPLSPTYAMDETFQHYIAHDRKH